MTERERLIAEVEAYLDLVIACVGVGAPDVPMLRRVLVALREADKRTDWWNTGAPSCPRCGYNSSDDPMDAPAYDDPDAPTLGEMIDRAENARDAMEDR